MTFSYIAPPGQVGRTASSPPDGDSNLGSPLPLHWHLGSGQLFITACQGWEFQLPTCCPLLEGWGVASLLSISSRSPDCTVLLPVPSHRKGRRMPHSVHRGKKCRLSTCSPLTPWGWGSWSTTSRDEGPGSFFHFLWYHHPSVGVRAPH